MRHRRSLSQLPGIPPLQISERSKHPRHSAGQISSGRGGVRETGGPALPESFSSYPRGIVHRLAPALRFVQGRGFSVPLPTHLIVFVTWKSKPPPFENHKGRGAQTLDLFST